MKHLLKNKNDKFFTVTIALELWYCKKLKVHTETLKEKQKSPKFKKLIFLNHGKMVKNDLHR